MLQYCLRQERRYDISTYSSVTRVKTRIKIYKKEGFDFANQSVQYYKGQLVSFTNAITYNLVDGKIEKTKLQSDGQFSETINKYLFRKKITMPNVKVGSVIEFEYEIKSETYGIPDEWQFQSNIPVDFNKYETTISDYLIFKTSFKGAIMPRITKVNVGNRETLTTYVLENIPAIKEEGYVNNIDNYKASINHELSVVSFPGYIYKEFSTDWNAVVKTIYDSSDFGEELNKTGFFEEDIDNLIKGVTTPKEKTALILDYVKELVKWNKYESYYCDQGMRKAYKEKTGNSAEINLLLTAMLRYAGVTANPVLISTRSNGIVFYPSLRAYNYVITAIEAEDGLILLDATEKFSLPNVLPLRDLNWFGRLVRKDGTSTQVNLMPTNLSRETINMNAVVSKEGFISGKLRRQLTNQMALSFREKNTATKEESYLEGLEKENNGIEVNEYTRDNDLNLSQPIVESYTFKDSKDFESINDKIYIAPSLFLGIKENPFKQEARAYPVDYGFPIQSKLNISIDIPEGYAIETLPPGLNIAAVDGIGAFKAIIAASGNKIQVSMTFEISKAIVSADYYQALKEFYQKVIEKQNEKIILKKL